MIRTLINNQKILTVIALIFFLIFCAELTTTGLTKFHSVLAGGENYHDFPVVGFSFQRLIVNTAYISLNIIYVIWLLQKPKENSYLSFLDILKKTGIFVVIAFITYPFSSDIYLYLHYGLMNLNKVNPYLYPANSFTSSLSPFLHWSQTSTYGPFSQLFFMGAASTVAVSPVLGVYVFKIFCVLVHGMNTYLIWHLLKENRLQSKVTIAYLLNPLLLTEHLAGAHVDVFVCNTLIILIACIYYRSFIAAILAAFMGFSAKTLPIIWLPLIASFLVRQRRWKALLIAAFILLIIITILSYTVFPTLEAWKSLFNPGVAEGLRARSLHHLLNILLKLSPNFTDQTKQVIMSGFKSLTYLIFIIYYGWILLKIFFKRSYSETNLISDIGWTTLVLFLFATPWLMTWYPSVLLPIAALSINSQLFVLTSLTFCLSSGIIVGTGSGQSAISTIMSLSTVAPPILMLLFGRKFLNQIIERVTLLNNGAPSKVS